MKTRTLSAVPVTGPGRDAHFPVRLALPRPTGPFPVGLSTLHLRDDTRADPQAPARRRELTVSLWYPARARTGWPAPYLSVRESAALIRLLDAPGVPAGALTRTRTHARLDAGPLGLRAPLVLLSPGFLMPRGTLTSLAEDLASRGYVVAGIGHEPAGTAFPDDPAMVTMDRAADVSFVLDELTGPRPVWGGGRLIDGDRIAMAGHAAGGDSVLPAMLGDHRIGAGLTMDGLTEASTAGVDRPFLMLGTPGNQPGGADGVWDRTWSALSGWKRWLTVDGAQHHTFGDTVLLAEQLGLHSAYPLSGPWGVQITRVHLAAFADLHLRDRPQPLLNGPDPHYPEVRYWAA
ncbi:alpha/beta hydrolase family protein [Amycolatopsis nigrescens]|uniref:alpha/beta hydrolase family protein n=1 Tax=Amycolatopsis nigrescens TaxID=381445 RepID=UPI00035F0027|nr:alpha/beta hydrolase [Amycolatopsis nigrescens]